MQGPDVDFKQRCNEEELMDLPSTSPEEFKKALWDIQWVNRHLGGTRTLIEAIQPLAREINGKIGILDLGTGSADIPIAITQWARRQGREVEITALDLHPVAVATCREMVRDYPEITVMEGDALNVPFANNSFDIVTSSMFMHHLQQEEAVRLLAEMARIGRRGFVVNDLERHPLAYWSIRLLGKLTGKGRIFKNDAPLSVLRGFRRPELEILKQASGLQTMEILHRSPYRWVLRWEKDEE